jgi:hypothetical protein
MFTKKWRYLEIRDGATCLVVVWILFSRREAENTKREPATRDAPITAGGRII